VIQVLGVLKELTLQECQSLTLNSSPASKKCDFMLSVRRLSASAALLVSVGITAASSNALSPTQIESRLSQSIAQNQQAQDAQVPDIVKHQYREDATELALRLLVQEGETSEDSVELPADLIQTLYNALIQVYQATNEPARNAVVNTYNIHAVPRVNTRELLVGVDSTKAWTQAWRKGKRLTGNAEIDALMEQFDLDLKQYLSVSNIAVLRTGRSLNTPAIAKLFNGIQGVRYANVNGALTDGGDIQAELKGNYWQLKYSIGFGDCMAGCSDRTTWTFNVYPDRGVQFAGRSGSRLPSPRELPSGIQGRSISSQLPGIIRRNPDGTEQRVEPTISPVRIPIAVLNQGGDNITRIEPDEEGYFRIGLPPGSYTLVPQFQPSNYFVLSNSRDELQTIRVAQGKFTTIPINYTVLTR
jgi:hypothetical protein